MLLARIVAAALLLALLQGTVPGQDVASSVDPREFGLDLPAGPVTPGEKQSVTTSDEDGQPVVGRIHVRVGNGAVVMLPDGELVGRRDGQFALTDRKFEPHDKDRLSARLAAKYPGFKIKSTYHYIYVYSSSDEFQFGTS